MIICAQLAPTLADQCGNCLADRFFSAYNDHRVNFMTHNGKVRGIERYRMMHLTIGYPGGIQHICHRMRLWKHIFDLLAGFNIPFLHIVGAHYIHFFRSNALPFTDFFHDLKGDERIHAFQGKIVHYIIAGAYHIFKRGSAGLDQIPRVV